MPYRSLTILAALLAARAADANFYLVLPPTGDAPARVVFSGSTAVDPRADPGPAESFAATAPMRVAPGGLGYLNLEGASPGASVTVAPPARVSQTNYAEPTLVVHAASWQVAPGESGTAPAGEGLALTCHPAGGGTVFAATLAGKPVAARVTVSAPGMKRPATVQTGPDGLTRAFHEKGLLSARVSLTESTPGEYQGQKYKQVRRHATLTTTAQ